MKWVLVYIIVGTLGEPSAVNAMGPKYFFDTIFKIDFQIFSQR